MIRWKQSGDSFVESHCGHWKITPEYWSCAKPQAFTLWRDGKKVAYTCKTQHDAKETAETMLWQESRK